MLLLQTIKSVEGANIQAALETTAQAVRMRTTVQLEHKINKIKSEIVTKVSTWRKIKTGWFIKNILDIISEKVFQNQINHICEQLLTQKHLNIEKQEIFLNTINYEKRNIGKDVGKKNK